MADRRRAVWVVILFGICAFIQARFTYESIDRQLHITDRARVPFSIDNPSGAAKGIQPEAKTAGIKQGDRPVSIDGRPVRGIAGVIGAVRGLHVGDLIQVIVDRHGAPVSASVTLAPENAKPLNVQDWVLASFLYYLIPWFCIALGFTVAFLRPDDLLAWLLLLLMLSFSAVTDSDSFLSTVAGWEPWLRPAGVFYQSFFNSSWGLWMLLFGQYFPDRISNGFWNRLARWILGVPLAALAVVTAMVNVLAIEDATAIAGLQRFLTRLAPVLIVVMMTAISTFFINTGQKLAKAKTPDTRRRLRLMYFGTTISLTPLFLLVIATVVLRKSLDHVPNWLTVPALLMLFLFPLTLAYVIVVEKAMDLKVAIRQGLQYALARRGVRVLTVLTTVAVVLTGVHLLNQPGVRGPQQSALIAVMIVIIVRLRVLAERLRTWVDRRFFREAVDTERVLRELGENVRSIVELQPLLQTVTSTISNVLHVPRVAVMTLQNGYFAPAHALGYGSPGPHMHFAASSAVAERLGRSREPLRVSLTRPEAWVDKQVTELGPELLLPLAVKDRLLGFLSLGPKRSEEPYTATDVALLESVASQTGLALENSRLTEAVASEVAQRERLNRELEIAREVQQRLFPQSGPEIPGLDYAGKCRPASSVGGDYYDFVLMCDGRLGIAIGDISGKGVPAALLMASLQASLRGLAIANPPALGSMMENLNRLIYDASPSNRYATFFYGVYDPHSRDFLYVNGGHNPPMVFRGNEVLRLEEGGPVVGLFGPAQYAQGTIRLQPGDTLLLYTDGVSETMNEAEDEFDEERLIAAARAGAGLKSAELIDRIIAACDEFAAGAPQHDDMTLVVVRVE